MRKSATSVHQPRLFPLTAALLALAMIITSAVIFLAQQTAAHPTAQAAPKPPIATKSARPGVGYTIRGQWFGTWKAVGGTGYCIDFDRSDPNSKGSKKLTGNVPGMSAEQSAEVKFVANKYGPTKSKVDAAAAAIFVWKTQDTKRFNNYYKSLLKKHAVSAAIQKRAAQIAAEAKLHGPYRLKITMGAGLVGQSISGTAVLTTSKGKAVSGAVLHLAVNGNAKLTKKASHTDSKGRFTFTNQVTRVGSVRTDATLALPSSAGALITEPTAGHQRLVAATKLTQTAKAFAISQRSVGSPTLKSACSGDCHGAAPVTVSMTNAAGSATLREYIYSNGKQVASFDVAAGKTASKQLNLPDAAKVTTRYCYLTSTGTCTNPAAANAGALTVVCPPWVQYTYSGTCPCDPGKNLTYAVSVPANTTRTYTVTLSETRAGATVAPQTITMTKGQRHTFSALRFAKGDQVRLSFTVLGTTHLLDDMTQLA